MAFKLSNLVQNQLPEFISNNYSAFASFLEKYYESLEIKGQPLDILSNLTKYYDINFYEKTALEQGSNLASFVSLSSNTIELVDASSFPDENGYVKINEEICFYKFKEGNTLNGVFRGISGATKLGDLYSETKYTTSLAENHEVGSYVENISNLFLFAIVKSFESQYLSSIPDKYLKDGIDKRTLIKNITDFYRAKGSEKSIKFIFNSLVSEDITDKAFIKRPSEETLKLSTSDWISDYTIKVEIISGNAENLVGEKIIQENPYSSVIVDRVNQIGNFAELIIDPSSVNSEFEIYGVTKLTTPISGSKSTNFVIDVVSTNAWSRKNKKIYIKNEEFEISDKNVRQFTIKSRTGSNSYVSGEYIYSKKPYTINGVVFQITGTVYNLFPKSKIPYSLIGDSILESKSAKSSNDPVVFDVNTNSYRWIPNVNNERPSVPTISAIQNKLSSVNANVVSILEDETYFYICSSGYPSYPILDAGASGQVSDNKYLKIIKKTPVISTEIYTVGFDDVGIFLDGTLAYSKKSESFVRYGKIISSKVINKGRGYKKPPVVLVNGSPNKAKAIISGDVVSDIEIITDQIYRKTPNVVITSGRNAQISARVTNGRVTNLIVEDSGEYYVSPPIIEIIDRAGKGRFARYESVISSNGKLIGIEKIEEGRNYTQQNIQVRVIPQGSGALAEVDIKKWFKNRFTEVENLDENNGQLFNKKFGSGKTYGILGNPKKLRYKLNDNINSLLIETQTSHSKIIGYAYDGNPIYGPYAYADPLDPNSNVVRMRSGYTLNTTRKNGPSVSVYPLGTFDEDYIWNPNVLSGKLFLDKNNGRFCVTPDYPNGVYAYFTTIDTEGSPEYPYILGENYYSIPTDSNYNSAINQDDIPKSAKILDFSEYLDNGRNFSAFVADIQSGFVSGVFTDKRVTEHNPGNILYVDNSNTSGEDFEASVESVFGKDIEYLRSRNTVGIFASDQNVYLFSNYLLRQRNTNISGSIVGDVLFNNQIVLESIDGVFSEEDTFDLIDPETGEITKVLNILLDKSSSFTSESEILLTDGRSNPDSIRARGKILESTFDQNIVRILVLSGNFDDGLTDDNLILQSSSISDTTGSKISFIRSLSENININIFDYNFAIAKTSEDHNLVVNDLIDLDINPNDSETSKKYFVRKRLFQQIKLNSLSLNSRINDTGIGNISILTGGLYSSSGIFDANLGNASVSVTISEFLDQSSISLEVSVPGTGYSVGNGIPVSGGSGNGLVLNIDSVGPNGEVLSVSVSINGFNYANGDLISPIQLNGQGCVVNVSYTTYNSVSSVNIIDKGSNFKEDSILQLSNLVGTNQIKPALFRVDHSGLSENEDRVKLSSVTNISNDDFLIIENEIVRVFDVDYLNRIVFITRGEKNTKPEKHFNNTSVKFFNFKYNFTPGSFIPEIGTDLNSPKIYTYDEQKNILILAYEYGVLPQNTPNITISTFLKDGSFPERKSVNISSVEDKIFKLEFSEESEDNFIVNPNIEVQLYYKYVFDTSHPSMLDTYLDFSPSINYNIITEEKIIGESGPGTNSDQSFVSLKFGFGPALSSNEYINKSDLRFSNFYYFVVADNVDTNGSKLQIIKDPLVGEKILKYVTNNKFVYEVNKVPQRNGTGDIKYITYSQNAIGLINSIKVDNGGKNYLDIPTIVGIQVPEFREAEISPKFNSSGGIESFEIINSGSGYINPSIIISGDGIPGVYIPTLQQGKIINISVRNPGKNYKSIPTIKIIESANKIYAESNTIGAPKIVNIKNSGEFYTSDHTSIPSFTSTYAILLSDVDESKFVSGKKVFQYNNYGEIIFSGRVAGNGIRKGSNILRLDDISGQISKDYLLEGSKIISVLFTEYEAELKSFYNKLGFYNSEKGLIGVAGSKITDSFYYQDYSYVIRSKTPIDLWRDLIKDVVHPAGFKLFGEVAVEAKTGFINQPVEQSISPVLISVNAGIKDAFTFTQKTQVTEIFETTKNRNIQRGKGRLSLNQEDLSTTNVRDVYLSPPFDGYIDPDTNQILGTKTFNILDKNNGLPVFPYNESSIVVSLSSVIQEPKVAYTIEGNKITFSTAPLGRRIVEDQEVEPLQFNGKVFNYIDSEKNEKYFKKIKNIFQRSGIWIDASNQIRSNKNFIIEETIGYFNSKYPDSSFDTRKFNKDIGFIIDAFEKDLRFGGNSETVIFGEIYYNLIDEQLEEIKDAYNYAAKLCASSIKNWDITFIDDKDTQQLEVNIFPGSDIVSIPNTFGIVEGMYISSGDQFPLGTQVLEIIDETTVRLTNPAFLNITEDEIFVFTVPLDEIELLGENEYSFNGIVVEGTLEVLDETTIIVRSNIAKLRQITFSLSKVNPGKYVDAADLIFVNKKYIIDQTISYIKESFVDFKDSSEKKFKRDLGYYIDDVIYHLKFGGNNRIITYAERYLIINKLNYITNAINEIDIAIEYSTALMVEAINNPGDPFETVNYDVPPDVPLSVVQCADVVSAINSYKNSFTFILENGPNLIQKDFGNQQRSGKYTDLLTYSNFNILNDSDLLNTREIDGVIFSSECAEVISALYTLNQTLKEVLDNGPDFIEKSLPDYFNGKNKIFDLYDDSNEILKTEENENLLIYINGVLQRPTAYKILRFDNPNETDKIEFTEAPKWDQSEAQIRLNQGTAVDYFYAFSIGEYQRKTIEEKFINIRRDYVILDEDKNPTTPTRDSRYNLVFVDGVLQTDDKDYLIKGNRIIFNKKLNYFKPETGETIFSKVDIISFLGEKNKDTLTAFNFQSNTYSSIAEIKFYYEPIDGDFYEDLEKWNENSNTEVIQLFNGENYIGTITDFAKISEPIPGILVYVSTDINPLINDAEDFIFKKPFGINVTPLSFNTTLIVSEDLTFVGPEFYVYGNITVLDDVTLIVDETATLISANTSLKFKINSDNERLMERVVSPYLVNSSKKNKAWRIINKVSSSVLEGDEIKIDGEKSFREIIQIPDIVKTTEYNLGKNSGNNFYGDIIVSPSDDFPSGFGLSVTARIDDVGKVVGLDYNRPDIIRLQQLNQIIPALGIGYEGGVYIDFIPVDGNGGGAFATTLSSNGIIYGLKLISSGFGYTKPPIAVITRGYDINKSHRAISPIIERDYNISIFTPVIINSQEILVVDAKLKDFNIFAKLEETTIDELNITKIFKSNSEGINKFNTIIENSQLTVYNSFISSVEQLGFAVETLFIKPYESGLNIGKTSETSAEVVYLNEYFVGAGDTLLTPETLNQNAALINADFLVGDTVLFVTSTEGFPPSGFLQIGTEVVQYSSKEDDRFIIAIRGAKLTLEKDHLVGTIVKIYLDFLNANRKAINIIETDGRFVDSPYAISNEITLSSGQSSDTIEQKLLAISESNIITIIETEMKHDVIIDSSILKITSSENFIVPFINLSLEDQVLTTIFNINTREDLLSINAFDPSLNIISNLYEFVDFEIKESNITIFTEYQSTDSLIVELSESSASLIADNSAIDVDLNVSNVSLLGVIETSGLIELDQLVTISSQFDINSNITLPLQSFSDGNAGISDATLESDLIKYFEISDRDPSINVLILGSKLRISIEETLISIDSISTPVSISSSSEINYLINSLSPSTLDISQYIYNDLSNTQITSIANIENIGIFDISVIELDREVQNSIYKERIEIGESIATRQEVTKYPEESIRLSDSMVSDIEFSSQLSVSPETITIDISTSIDISRSSGSIDTFNENIITSIIDTNE